MNNSRKSISSSSTRISEKKHEEPKPTYGALPHQHPLTIPTSFNCQSLMQTPTFPVLTSHEGARYQISSVGYLLRDGVSMNEMSKSFKEKPFILEIPCGFDIINSVMQLAQRYQLSVTVLTGQGLISEVDLMAYPPAAIPPVHVSGCYHMVSISGTFSCVNGASGEIISCFNVSFTDGGGNIMGGLVASTMKAASVVTLVVTITNP